MDHLTGHMPFLRDLKVILMVLAFPIGKVLPIVQIMVVAPFSGIYLQHQLLQGLLPHIGLRLHHGNDTSPLHIDGACVQRRILHEPCRAGQSCAGPVVVPDSLRQVHHPLVRPRLHHRRNKDISTHKKLIIAGSGRPVLLILEYQRAHNGRAGALLLIEQIIEIGNQPIPQLYILPIDVQHLLAELPWLLLSGAKGGMVAKQR